VQHCLRFYSVEEFLKGELRCTIIRAVLRHSNSVSCTCVIVPLSILLFSMFSLLAICF
jgi:hypothetical protein